MTNAIADNGFPFVETEEEFNELRVDKWIVSGEFRFILEADGDLKGGAPGRRARGSAWTSTSSSSSPFEVVYRQALDTASFGVALGE